MNEATPQTPSSRPTIQVPPACPDEYRSWLLCTLASTSAVRREAEDVLNVLDGRAPALTDRARVWLEKAAAETTARGGWARELLAVCGGVGVMSPADAKARKQGLPFVSVADMAKGTRFICPNGNAWIHAGPHDGHRGVYRATREFDGVHSCFAACSIRPVLGAP